MNKQKIIITAPSLDPAQNVSGVSTVVQFVIDNNKEKEYQHFQIGKMDKEGGGALQRVVRILKCYREWKTQLSSTAYETQSKIATKTKRHFVTTKTIVHYSFPLSAPSILRDPWFMHYALKKGYKMVVHVHGGLFLTAPKIPFILEKILRWVFSWDVPFIVLSEREKEILQSRFGAKRVEVLPNCPDAPKSNETQSEIATKTKRPSDYGNANGNRNALNQHKVLTIGYLGRIEPNKGMTELLEALKKCKAEGRMFKVRFAGKEQTEGEYLPKYREALGENFEYCGLVSGESKKQFLDSLDVFVMPTYFEGLPMSMLETMSYGAVPVVTKVGSIPTVVRDGENGLFVEKKDVDSICEALKKLDSDRALLDKISDEAQKTIQENFSPERYVEKLNEIYAGL